LKNLLIHTDIQKIKRQKSQNLNYFYEDMHISDQELRFTGWAKRP
jgi:hypothetical protein